MLPTLSRSVNVIAKGIWSGFVRKRATSTITPPLRSCAYVLTSPHVRADLFTRARAVSLYRARPRLFVRRSAHENPAHMRRE
jgi:hypothetical protein